jgi:chromosome segregation ATPase
MAYTDGASDDAYKLQQENAALKKNIKELCDEFAKVDKARDLLLQRAKQAEKKFTAMANFADALRTRAEQAEARVKELTQSILTCNEAVQYQYTMKLKAEADLKRLRVAVEEVMDGTLPYLAEKRLKAALDELEEKDVILSTNVQDWIDFGKRNEERAEKDEGLLQRLISEVKELIAYGIPKHFEDRINMILEEVKI